MQLSTKRNDIFTYRQKAILKQHGETARHNTDWSWGGAPAYIRTPSPEDGRRTGRKDAPIKELHGRRGNSLFTRGHSVSRASQITCETKISWISVNSIADFFIVYVSQFYFYYLRRRIYKNM